MVYKLFSCCIPVKGYRRSIVVDTQRSDYFIIPNGLCDILVDYGYYSPKEIKNEVGLEFVDIIEEYFDYLNRNDLIFECEFKEINRFPKIDLGWEEPHYVINSIIDINERSQHDFEKIFAQLNELMCKHIEIRFFTQTTTNYLSKILEYTNNRCFHSIDIILPYNSNVSCDDLKSLFVTYQRVTNIVIYNSPDNRIVNNISECNDRIYFNNKEIKDSMECGVIKPSSFTMDLNSFCEAQSYNSCLNRKICIDTYGDIKNCPSMTESYGNIGNTSLQNVVSQKRFQSLWNISKDKIDVCKHCEYRYICSDCRAYLKESNNIFSQPAKCTYNPYIAKWQGQEGYLSVEEWIASNENFD